MDKLFSIGRSVIYTLVFIGVYFGVAAIARGDVVLGVARYCQIGIIPLALWSFLAHTLFAGRIHRGSGSNFFEYECGGVNLAIALVLLIGLLCRLPLIVMVCVLAVYFVYLAVAALVHLLHGSYKKFLLFLPMLVPLAYFIVEGLLVAKPVLS